MAQVVVERCTVPADEPCQVLREAAKNLGETDVEALLNLRPQPPTANAEGGYHLFRIGDCVAARDIHAAMLDANRL